MTQNVNICLCSLWKKNSTYRVNWFATNSWISWLTVFCISRTAVFYVNMANSVSLACRRWLIHHGIKRYYINHVLCNNWGKFMFMLAANINSLREWMASWNELWRCPRMCLGTVAGRIVHQKYTKWSTMAYQFMKTGVSSQSFTDIGG